MNELSDSDILIIQITSEHIMRASLDDAMTDFRYYTDLTYINMCITACLTTGFYIYYIMGLFILFQTTNCMILPFYVDFTSLTQ